jgi:hypothetical protein
MRTITIVNKKLREYLNEKDILVKKGRKISERIEEVEKEILKTDDEERKITESIVPVELISKGEKLKSEINAQIILIESIGEEIMQLKLAGIPKVLKDKHYALRQEKETLERDRNKLALKVQKIKDRAIPIIQKEVKPQLEKYDDIETATVKGEKIIVNCFNHLEEWKEKFEKNKK